MRRVAQARQGLPREATPCGSRHAGRIIAL